SILLRRHPPDGPEPHRQRFPRILEDRARRQRRLVLAASADQQVAVSRPSRSPATAWADKTLRPTQLQKVVPTRLFGSKPGLQFGQSTRVFLHSRLPQHIGLLESTEYPDTYIAMPGEEARAGKPGGRGTQCGKSAGRSRTALPTRAGSRARRDKRDREPAWAGGSSRNGCAGDALRQAALAPASRRPRAAGPGLPSRARP